MLPSLQFSESTVGGYLRDSEGGALADRLDARGLERSKATLFAAAAKRLLDDGVPPDTRAQAFWVPGRIEVLGKHTDYAGGRSLLAAVTRGFAVVSAERQDGILRLLASFALDEKRDEAEVALSGGAEPAPGSWATYPAAVAQRLGANFGVAQGVTLALECDLPEASGMSSSSAIICLTFLALAWRNALPTQEAFRRLLPTGEQLAHFLGCCENGQDCGPELPGAKGVHA